MMKSLRLLWGRSEDLPSPLAARLHLSSRMRLLAFRKPCEVPGDLPLTLKFYSSGDLIGIIHLYLPSITAPETRWIPIKPGENEGNWTDFGTKECSGPRVQLTLEPMRPLSPILELTEANECSTTTECGPISPTNSHETEQLRDIIESLQRERLLNSDSQKELQLKLMELQQTLVKERWENKINLEQMEVKYKGEISQLMMNLEKSKGMIKKEAALSENLTIKLAEAEEKLMEIMEKPNMENEILQRKIEKLEEKIAKKDLEIDKITRENFELEGKLETTESRLATASAQLSTLRTEHEAVLSTSKSLSVELNAAKSALKPANETSFSLSFLESEKVNFTQQLHEMQHFINKCKSDLSTAISENDKKDRELRNSATLIESLKAKLQAYETTIKVLKASAGVQMEGIDLVDEALREYMKGRKGVLQFMKVMEGVYTYGQKQVQVAVRSGEIVVKVNREVMGIEEFLGTGERGHHRSTSRPRSVDRDALGSSLHSRTMSNFMDFLPKQADVSFDLQSSTQRVHTDTDYISDRMSRPLLPNRDTTPKREYLKQTISSTLKVTEKSHTPRPKTKSRIMKM